MRVGSKSVQSGVSRGKRTTGKEAASGPYAKYHRSVRAYIAERVGSPQEAEDLAQEVFLAVGKRKPRNAKAYIFRVAKNLVRRFQREQLKKRQAGAKPDFGDYEAAGRDPRSRRISAKEWKRILAHGDVQLSAKLREAFELRFIEKLSCEEAAQTLGCSKWAFYKRTERAKRLLAEALKGGSQPASEF